LSSDSEVGDVDDFVSDSFQHGSFKFDEYLSPRPKCPFLSPLPASQRVRGWAESKMDQRGQGDRDADLFRFNSSQTAALSRFAAFGLSSWAASLPPPLFNERRLKQRSLSPCTRPFHQTARKKHKSLDLRSSKMKFENDGFGCQKKTAYTSASSRSAQNLHIRCLSEQIKQRAHRRIKTAFARALLSSVTDPTAAIALPSPEPAEAPQELLQERDSTPAAVVAVECSTISEQVLEQGKAQGKGAPTTAAAACTNACDTADSDGACAAGEAFNFADTSKSNSVAKLYQQQQQEPPQQQQRSSKDKGFIRSFPRTSPPFSGILLKKKANKRFALWRKRRFTVLDGKLFWLSASTTKKEEPLGFVDLRSLPASAITMILTSSTSTLRIQSRSATWLLKAPATAAHASPSLAAWHEQLLNSCAGAPDRPNAAPLNISVNQDLLNVTRHKQMDMLQQHRFAALAKFTQSQDQFQPSKVHFAV